MNDTITPVRSLDLGRHQTAATDVRISFADRLSMRIGLWLLLRAERRIDRERDADIRARTIESDRARQAHERTIMQAWQSGLRIY